MPSNKLSHGRAIGGPIKETCSSTQSWSIFFKALFIKKTTKKPWPGNSVGVSSQYAKVAGSIPGQGTYKNQPMNA